MKANSFCGLPDQLRRDGLEREPHAYENMRWTCDVRDKVATVFNNEPWHVVVSRWGLLGGLDRLGGY